jgi:hypothetical protein
MVDPNPCHFTETPHGINIPEYVQTRKIFIYDSRRESRFLSCTEHSDRFSLGVKRAGRQAGSPIPPPPFIWHDVHKAHGKFYLMVVVQRRRTFFKSLKKTVAINKYKEINI